MIFLPLFLSLHLFPLSLPLFLTPAPPLSHLLVPLPTTYSASPVTRCQATMQTLGTELKGTLFLVFTALCCEEADLTTVMNQQPRKLNAQREKLHWTSSTSQDGFPTQSPPPPLVCVQNDARRRGPADLPPCNHQVGHSGILQIVGVSPRGLITHYFGSLSH